MLAAIGIIYALRRRVHAFEWMVDIHASVPALVWTLVLTLVMGLTLQTDSGGVPWLSQMVSFRPFVLVYAWMLVVAGLAVPKGMIN